MVANKKPVFLRVLAIVFGVLLLAQQIFTYYYIKRLDSKYSGLINRKTTQLRCMNTISNESSNIQISLLSIAIMDTGKYHLYTRKIAMCEKVIDSQFVIMNNVAQSQKDKKAIADLQKEYGDYKAQYKPLLSLLLAENFTGTRQQGNIEKLRETFDQYLAQQGKKVEFFKDRAAILSDKFSHETYKTSTLMLIVGSLPYLVLGCALVISFIVIVILGNVMNWFRHQE